MGIKKLRTQRVSVELPIELKERLRVFSRQLAVKRGHFVSMQVCILETLTEHLPAAPGNVDERGKKVVQRALRSAG